MKPAGSARGAAAEVGIEIALRARRPAGELEAEAARARDYVRDLALRLDLPVEPRVTVGDPASELAAGEEATLVGIAGSEVRVDADGEPGALEAAILRCRRRLLTRDVIAACLARAGVKERRPSTAEGLRACAALLDAALVYGYSLGRFAEALPDLARSTDRAAWYAAFERAVAGFDSTGVRVEASADDVETWRLVAGESSAVETVLDAADAKNASYLELGATFHLDLAAAPDLERGACRIVVNDMPLPVGRRLGARSELSARVAAAVKEHAGALVNAALVDLYLAQLQRTYPELVRAARARFDAATIAHVLRTLARERFSIRDLRGILESLLSVDGYTSADFGQRIVFAPETSTRYPDPERAPDDTPSPPEYAECVRAQMRRYLTHLHSGGAATMQVLLLDPAIEQRMRASGGAPLGGAELRRLRDSVRRERRSAGAPSPLAVLVSMEARSATRAALEEEFPGLAVVSYQELAPETNLQPVARITLD